MPAAIKNLLFEQGVTFKWTLLLKDGAHENSPPLNLTGYFARLQMRDELVSPNLILDLTSNPGGGIIITPSTGRIDIKVSDAATSAMTFERAVYGLELVQPDGDVIRLYQGSAALSLEAAR